MASYNRIVLIGNLTREPDYKQLTSGQPVCKLGLASNRQYKNRQTGSMVQEVCFVDVDVFGPQAESCRQFLQKGRAVLIEGRLKFDTWQAPDGQTRSKHSIVADRVVFLSSGPQSEANVDSAVSGQGIEQDFAPAEPANAKKKRAASRPKVEEEKEVDADGGEFAFKDEPPFQDDLPF